MSQKLILTCIKNEGAFLLDWIAHNLALGIDHFMIFTNDCDDGTDALAERLQAIGIATHISNNDAGDKGPQWAAMNHKLVKNIPNGDWVFVSDIDEYLNIKTGDGTLTALLEKIPNPQAISIPWRFFGSARQIHATTAPVRETFTKTSPYPLLYPRQALMFKSFFQMSDAIQKPGIHAPRLKNGHTWQSLNWANGNGTQMQVFDPKTPILMGPNAGIELAQINHYALRSAKSFLVKAARGLANRKGAKIDLTYWMRRNFNGLEDRSILRLSDQTRAHLARLTRDPILSKLHEAASEWHVEQAERLAETPEGLNLLSGIMLAGDSRVLSPAEAQVMYRHHHALGTAELAL